MNINTLINGDFQYNSNKSCRGILLTLLSEGVGGGESGDGADERLDELEENESKNWIEDSSSLNTNSFLLPIGLTSTRKQRSAALPSSGS